MRSRALEIVTGTRAATLPESAPGAVFMGLFPVAVATIRGTIMSAHRGRHGLPRTRRGELCKTQSVAEISKEGLGAPPRTYRCWRGPKFVIMPLSVERRTGRPAGGDPGVKKSFLSIQTPRAPRTGPAVGCGLLASTLCKTHESASSTAWPRGSLPRVVRSFAPD